ncbi:Heat shock protein 81-1 [Spatholobus suberectus]|nr:Heat shock protein 81-1 [Spatholobus suberectus]
MWLNSPTFVMSLEVVAGGIGVNEDDDTRSQKDTGLVAEKKKKKIEEVSHKWSLVNKQKSIWMRKPEEITKEEYVAFFKNLTSDWE